MDCASLQCNSKSTWILKKILYLRRILYLLYWHILSYPILSYPILSYLILSYLILSYLIYPTLPYPTLPFPSLSCPVLSCPVLSCPVLSYPILSYPILSYLILSHLFPVRSAWLCSGSQSSQQILLFILMNQLQSHLEANSFQISFRLGRSDKEMHVQEPVKLCLPGFL